MKNLGVDSGRFWDQFWRKMPYLPYHRVNFKKSLGQFKNQSKQAFWAKMG